jgi:hypothetical protein
MMNPEPTDSPATPSKRKPPPAESSSKKRRERIAAAAPAPPVVAIVTHRVNPDRLREFEDLVEVLRPLMLGLLRNAGGGTWEVLRDHATPTDYLEVTRFPSELAREAFEDALIVNRKVSAVLAILDEILDSARADFRLYDPVEAGPTPAGE